MALCHITGTVQLPDGTNAAGRILVFKRNPETVVAQSGHGIIPDEVAVRVAADGSVDFKLYTDNYIGFLRNQRAGNERVFGFPVPEAASANFQDILQAVDPVEPLPSWLTEAFEARDEAEAAEISAVEAANRAELYAPAYYKDAAQFLNEVSVWPVGTRINARTGEVWDIVTAGTGDFDHPVSGIGVKYIPSHVFDLSAFPLNTAAQYLAALKIGCASSVINVVCPAATLDLVAGYSGTIPCAKRKRLVVRDGGLNFNIPPTGAAIVFRNATGAMADGSFFESDPIRFIRSNVSAPTPEEKNVIVSRFETTTLHEWEASGSRGFHITITNSKFATFDQCYAHDGYLGLLGPSGTDGMHALGCQFVKFYKCRAHDLGDDGMSVGRDVQAAGNVYFYDWCETAVAEDCHVSSIKTASVKAYARVRNLTIRGGSLEGGLGGAVWLVSGDANIIDAGIDVGVEHVKIIGTHFKNCRGWTGNPSNADTVGAVYSLRQVATSRNNQSFKSLIMDDCTFEDCAQVVRDDLYEAVKITATTVRRAIYKYPDAPLAMWLFQMGDLNGRGNGAVRADINIENLSIDGMDRYVQILRAYGGSRFGKRASVRMSGVYMRDVAASGAASAYLIWLTGWAHYDIRGISGDNVNSSTIYQVNDSTRVHPRSYIEWPNLVNITGLRPTEDGSVGTMRRGPDAVFPYANVAALPNTTYLATSLIRQAPWMAAAPVEWLVTTSGTRSATDISGVTCTAASGSKLVYVSDATKFASGQYVTVGGVSSDIVEMTDAVGGAEAYLTLRAAVTSAVSGAGTISWTAPVLRQFTSVAGT